MLAVPLNTRIQATIEKGYAVFYKMIGQSGHDAWITFGCYVSADKAIDWMNSDLNIQDMRTHDPKIAFFLARVESMELPGDDTEHICMFNILSWQLLRWIDDHWEPVPSYGLHPSIIKI